MVQHTAAFGDRDYSQVKQSSLRVAFFGGEGYAHIYICQCSPS